MIGQTLRRLFYQASIGDQSYRFMFKAPPAGEAVSIDCETTGLDMPKTTSSPSPRSASKGTAS